MKQRSLLEVLSEDEGSVEGVLTVIRQLREELLLGQTEDWENVTLEQFLEAMHAWIESVGPRIDGRPSWKFLEVLLGAAKLYE
jgi:hypothetical protein